VQRVRAALGAVGADEHEAALGGAQQRRGRGRRRACRRRVDARAAAAAEGELGRHVVAAARAQARAVEAGRRVARHRRQVRQRVAPRAQLVLVIVVVAGVVVAVLVADGARDGERRRRALVHRRVLLVGHVVVGERAPAVARGLDEGDARQRLVAAVRRGRRVQLGAAAEAELVQVLVLPTAHLAHSHVDEHINPRSLGQIGMHHVISTRMSCWPRKT
jgi:hypothetical protein